MAKRILAAKPESMQKMVKEAPLLPGCYIYRDINKKIIYIGKAKILRNRVKSYFSNYDRVEERIRQMIDLAHSVEFLIVDSEIEALILEINMIKKYKPKYNSRGVDDKSYAYVKFDKVKASRGGDKQPIPTVTVTHEKLKDNADYFGPYPDGRAVKRLLRRLRRIFPYCQSNNKVIIPANKNELIQSASHKPCFYFQINLCNGVCAGMVTRKDYENNLENIKKFFKGEKHKLQLELERKMQQAAKAQEFEKAARFRNMLHDIKYVGSNVGIDRDIDEVLIMQKKQDKKQRALDNFIEYLKFPPEYLHNQPGFKMECYDISNIQGTNAVGSMVVFVDGEPRPDLYRRFKIRMKNEPNDFAMLQEVLTRRFNQYLRSQSVNIEAAEKLPDEYVDVEGFTVVLPKDLKDRMKNWKPDESFSQIPNLIIIDGGKGQLSSSYKILTDFGLSGQLPMIGLAKREEEIFKVSYQFKENDYMLEDKLPKSNRLPEIDSDFEKIHLPRSSEALYLIQRIRDEAHRFGITYHRKLRSKAFIPQQKS